MLDKFIYSDELSISALEICLKNKKNVKGLRILNFVHDFYGPQTNIPGSYETPEEAPKILLKQAVISFFNFS